MHKPSFLLGLVSGLFMYAPHCTWLLVLLLTRSESGVALAVTIYMCIVVYFALTVGAWFFLYSKCKQFLMLFLATMVGYFFLLSKYSLWFASIENFKNGAGGYPFFSPLIPLASYKWFLKILALVAGVNGKALDIPSNHSFYHIKPDTQKELTQNPEVVGQRIYHKLAALKLHESKEENIVVLAPESTLPFPLNKHKHLVSLWSYVLPKRACMLIGACREEDGKHYQSIYLLKEGRIIKSYDKHHLVPFVEKRYNFWKNFGWSKKMFLHNKKEFSVGVGSVNFELGSNLYICPLVCSELFFCNVESELPVFCFVNDSWFTAPFKEWMRAYIVLKAVMQNNCIFYVGFQELTIFSKGLWLVRLDRPTP